jgi:hypothetical protein
MKEKKKTLNNTGRILMSSTLSKKNTNAKKKFLVSKILALVCQLSKKCGFKTFLREGCLGLDS